MVYAELISKNTGDINSSALATGGKLTPQQGKMFFSLVFALSALKDIVTLYQFDNETKYIDKMDVDARVMYPMDEGVDPGKRAGIALTQVALTPFDTMTIFEVTDKFLRQNIEGRSIALTEKFGEQMMNNMEDFNLNADLIGPSQPESLFVKDGSTTKRVRDPLFMKADGWMKQADAGHIVDAAGLTKMSTILIKAKKAMPAKYKKNLNNLKFITPIDIADVYQQELSMKNTNLGDQAMVGTISLKSYGISLEPIPLMSSTPIKVKRVTLTGTTAVSLGYKYLDKDSIWVTPTTLDSENAEDPYIDTTDYVINETNGTIARSGGGSAIADGQIVDVTFYSRPEILLTDPKNLVMAANTDSVSVEKQRISNRRVTEYSISASIDVKIINPDAVVKIINIDPEILETGT